jgi:hypothetical protein
MLTQFSICVLLYGGDEHATLHARCLTSLMCGLPREGVELRLGLNQVTSQATRMLIDRLVTHFGEANVRIFDGGNIGKYRRMREMFCDIARPYVMWFDDDSYLKPGGGSEAWLADIASRMAAADAGVLGGVYRQQLSPIRRSWLERHPGYRGILLGTKYEYFVTGGWWVAQTALLRELDYPEAALHHNGGDRLLGTLVTQAGRKLIDFRDCVAINANQFGDESTAPRRGLNMKGLGDSRGD